ncbi:unnamed protein product [Lota lota]
MGPLVALLLGETRAWFQRAELTIVSLHLDIQREQRLAFVVSLSSSDGRRISEGSCLRDQMSPLVSLLQSTSALLGVWSVSGCVLTDLFISVFVCVCVCEFISNLRMSS